MRRSIGRLDTTMLIQTAFVLSGILVSETVFILISGILVSVLSDVTTEEKNPRVFGVHLSDAQIDRLNADVVADRPKVLRMVEQIQNEPEAFDWRETHPEYMTPVRDQGRCMSCWAFAFTDLVSAVYAKAHSEEAAALSKSELVECVKDAKNCSKAGTFEDGYEYTIKFGLVYDKVYPYVNGRGQIFPCSRKDLTKTKVNVVDFTKTENATHMKKLLFKEGPIMVYLNGALVPMTGDDSYDIIRKDDKHCCPDWMIKKGKCLSWLNSINHAALLVGYGVENGVPYWVAKNSWGPTSGKGGYFRIERGTNACAVERYGFLVTTS